MCLKSIKIKIQKSKFLKSPTFFQSWAFYWSLCKLHVKVKDSRNPTSKARSWVSKTHKTQLFFIPSKTNRTKNPTAKTEVGF